MHRRGLKAMVVLISLLFLGNSVDAVNEYSDSDFQNLIRAYDSDPDRYRYSLARIPKEKLHRDYALESLEIAKASPKSVLARNALIWFFLVAPNDAAGYPEACKMIEDNFSDSPLLDRICLGFHPMSVPKHRLLWLLMKTSKNEIIRGNACYSLALDTQTTSPKKSEKLFKRTINKYGKVVLAATKDVTLGSQASDHLYELQHVSVGRRAIPTAGIDSNGRQMKLDEFRGKVVMLSFFGEWCAPCRALYPVERALVQKFQAEPFVLLGVNTDSEEKLRKVIADKTVQWPCWFDGGSNEGPIVKQWHVTSFPKVFLIDKKGVIRFVDPPRDEGAMSKSIVQLLGTHRH